MSELEKIVILKLNTAKKSPVLAKELIPDVVKRIGSEFKKGTRDCIRGLSLEQERILLPTHLGTNSDSHDFSRKAKDFWADFSVTPTEEGLRLNIATETKSYTTKDGAMEIEIPVNELDYMIYNFARQSSKVAKTKEELEDPQEFDFILINLHEQEKLEQDKYLASKNATLEFSKLISKGDESIIDAVIRNLKELAEPFDFTEPLVKKEMYLQELMQRDLAKFTKIATDGQLKVKALLREALEASEITLEGSHFFLGEENLGTAKSALSFLENPANSAKVATLKARLENFHSIQKTL